MSLWALKGRGRNFGNYFGKSRKKVREFKMPSNLKRRVERLEGGGKGRILTVVQFPGDSKEDAIERAGIEPTDDDIVLIIRRFSDPTEGEPK